MSNQKRLIGIFLLVVIIDQGSKFLVHNSLAPGDSIPIIPNFFNLVLTYNPGAAFGILANLPDTTRYIALAITTIIALAAVLYFFVRDYKDDLTAKMALSLIVGGAVGNIIDRVSLGMVIDFLDFYYKDYHWPAFNAADSAICLGVIILFFRKPTRITGTVT